MNRKCIVLMSGGLDSTLAAKILLEQGIEVIGLYLTSPFGCENAVEKVCEGLGIRLIVREKGEAYIDLVKNPKYGYGRNMNPCIDCRIYMFEIAHKVMEEERADFIVTGEVLGQRPMSQRRDALHVIDRDSEMGDLVLRPLSAKHLAPTLPEREGWVDREKLLSISGRARQEQLRLAEEFHLTGYETPGGGCLLTDPIFSQRLREFFDDRPDATAEELRLLRHGRQFRLDPEREGAVRIILGRNREENEKIERLSSPAVEAGRMIFYRPIGFPAPVAVVTGVPAAVEEEPADLDPMVARLILRYTKKGEGELQIERRRGGERRRIPVQGNVPILR